MLTYLLHTFASCMGKRQPTAARSKNVGKDKRIVIRIKLILKCSCSQHEMKQIIVFSSCPCSIEYENNDKCDCARRIKFGEHKIDSCFARALPALATPDHYCLLQLLYMGAIWAQSAQKTINLKMGIERLFFYSQ